METLDEKIARVNREETTLREYDAGWPAQFEAEKQHLLSCLPRDSVGRIEHFGSTAVPGLAAKPVVDMLVEVRSLEETKARIAPILEALGYDYFWRPSFGDSTPPFYAWFIKRDSSGKRTHHIHMVEAHFEHWDRLHFRDFLIAHPAVAAEYADLKRTLSKRHPDDRSAYTSGKSEFVVRVTEAARGFRGATLLAEAFNRHDKEAMSALLAPDATAQVLGSPFPEEIGAATIATTSFTYLLDDAARPLGAEARMLKGDACVLLRRQGDGALDVLFRIRHRAGKLTRIEYLVTGFRRDEMLSLVNSLGIPVAPRE